MPDSILNLADFTRAMDLPHDGATLRVIPQTMEAGSAKLHPRFFYVEDPKGGQQVYQIDASRLCSYLADGACSRGFSVRDVIRMLTAAFARVEPAKILKAVSL